MWMGDRNVQRLRCSGLGRLITRRVTTIGRVNRRPLTRSGGKADELMPALSPDFSVTRELHSKRRADRRIALGGSAFETDGARLTCVLLCVRSAFSASRRRRSAASSLACFTSDVVLGGLDRFVDFRFGSDVIGKRFYASGHPVGS